MAYLVCPKFETEPHPVLVRRVKLSLRACDLYCVDYSLSRRTIEDCSTTWKLFALEICGNRRCMSPGSGWLAIGSFDYNQIPMCDDEPRQGGYRYSASLLRQ